MSLGDLGIGSINGGPIGTKNVIINGNFGINQRGVSGTVTLAAGAYGHDRWKAGASGCTYTFATSNNVTTLTISSGSLIQVIEGLNLYSGTYTLSWTGTAQGKIGAGSYAGSGVTGAAVGGTNLNIEFNTGTVSLVQFEQGSVATPFERRDIGREVIMCQRYFFNAQTTGGSSVTIAPAYIYSSTQFLAHMTLPVTMRATPTISWSALAVWNSSGSSISLATLGTGGAANLASIRLDGTVASGLVAGNSSMLQTGTPTAGTLTFNAEL